MKATETLKLVGMGMLGGALLVLVLLALTSSPEQSYRLMHPALASQGK